MYLLESFGINTLVMVIVMTFLYVFVVIFRCFGGRVEKMEEMFFASWSPIAPFHGRLKTRNCTERSVPPTIVSLPFKEAMSKVAKHGKTNTRLPATAVASTLGIVKKLSPMGNFLGTYEAFRFIPETYDTRRAKEPARLGCKVPKEHFDSFSPCLEFSHSFQLASVRTLAH